MNCKSKTIMTLAVLVLALAFVGITAEDSEADTVTIPVTYTVGAKAYTVTETVTDGKITLAETPLSVPSGKIFGGWATTADGTTPVKTVAVTEETTSVTVYAILTDAPPMPTAVAVSYTVGTTTYTVTETVVNGKITLSEPKANMPDGKIFGGWATTADGTSAVKTLDAVAGQTTATVYAILIPTSTSTAFDIVYVIPGHANVTVTVPTGTPFPVKLLTSAEFGTYDIPVYSSDYSQVFAGWYAVANPAKDAKAISEVSATQTVSDMTVYAVYKDNSKYTVTFIVDDQKTTATFWNGQPVAMPSDPVKDGYNFVKWDVSEDGLTYTAVFKAVEPTPEPVPVEKKDDSGMTAILCIVGIVVLIGAGLFVWTLKKDNKL